MKSIRMRKVALPALSLTVGAALLLAGCSGSGDDASAEGTDKITIGISQFVQAPPLDAAVAGFKQAFADAGIDVDFTEQNANGEVPTATTIAQTFVSDDLDLVLAVATPSAQAAMQNITDVPVLFTAVTDPVAADLVESTEKPGSNVTGTSDMSPVADQIALVKEISPDAKKIGIVYSSGEVNSEVQVELAIDAAEQEGMEVVEQTVTNANELKQAAEALGDVDAIWTPSDNLVIAGLASIIGVAEDRGIPVVGSDSEHVRGGAVATIGIDYEKLGYQTGEMAIKILQGKADPATMPVETTSDLELSVNPDAAKRFGIELPESLLSRAQNVID